MKQPKFLHCKRRKCWKCHEYYDRFVLPKSMRESRLCRGCFETKPRIGGRPRKEDVKDACSKGMQEMWRTF